MLAAIQHVSDAFEPRPIAALVCYTKTVMNFEARYKKLNDNQRKAVDTIDGPVMVDCRPWYGQDRAAQHACGQHTAADRRITRKHSVPHLY